MKKTTILFLFFFITNRLMCNLPDTLKNEIENRIQYSEIAYNQGVDDFKLGNYIRSLDSFDEAISLNPNFGTAYFNRGSVKIRLKQFDEAIIDYDKALQHLNTQKGKILFCKGIALYCTQKFKDAELVFNKALKENYGGARPHYYKGVCCFRQQMYHEAIQEFNEALSVDSTFVYAYNDRAGAKRQLNDIDGALHDYKKASTFAPKSYTIYNNIGNIYMKKNKYKQAIDAFSKAIKLKKDYCIAQNNIGIAKSKLADETQDKEKAILLYNDAISDFEKAITLKPNYTHAYNNLGNTKHKIQEFHEAIQAYNHAIAIDSAYAGAYYNRGGTFEELCKFEKAKQDWAMATVLGIKLAGKHIKYYNK